jgi:hypothetical protein
MTSEPNKKRSTSEQDERQTTPMEEEMIRELLLKDIMVQNKKTPPTNFEIQPND